MLCETFLFIIPVICVILSVSRKELLKKNKEKKQVDRNRGLIMTEIQLK